MGKSIVSWCIDVLLRFGTRMRGGCADRWYNSFQSALVRCVDPSWGDGIASSCAMGRRPNDCNGWITAKATTRSPRCMGVPCRATTPAAKGKSHGKNDNEAETGIEDDG